MLISKILNLRQKIEGVLLIGHVLRNGIIWYTITIQGWGSNRYLGFQKFGGRAPRPSNLGATVPWNLESGLKYSEFARGEGA